MYLVISLGFVFRALCESPSKDSGAFIPAVSFSKFCFPPICSGFFAGFFFFLIFQLAGTVQYDDFEVSGSKQNRAFHCISKAEDLGQNLQFV